MIRLCPVAILLRRVVYKFSFFNYLLSRFDSRPDKRRNDDSEFIVRRT
jgi:hypothetical protein